MKESLKDYLQILLEAIELYEESHYQDLDTRWQDKTNEMTVLIATLQNKL